jgi:hypothetical protein
MDRPHPARPASTTGDQVARLVVGLLPLVLAGVVGLSVSAMLTMASDTCGVRSTAGICSDLVQQWMVWLPPLGAALGIAAAGSWTALRIRRGRAPRGALRLGWLVFGIAELAVLVLMNS